MKKQYEWQKKAFEKCKDLKAFMLKCACGAGKSFAAITIALYKALPVIVLTPKTVCDTWVEELKDAGVAEKDIWVYDTPTHTKEGKKYEEDFLKWIST